MILPDISNFIKKYIIKRQKSFFENDIINNKEKLTKEINGKSRKGKLQMLKNGGGGDVDKILVSYLNDEQQQAARAVLLGNGAFV